MKGRDAPLPSKTPQPQPLLTGETDNFKVRKALLLIERNISTPLSLEEIAERVHVSARQLERLFHAELGMSPTAFAMKLRFRKAYGKTPTQARKTRESRKATEVL
nr:AraC family transcriptional regulator [Glaciimonas sp. PCH181]